MLSESSKQAQIYNEHFKLSAPIQREIAVVWQSSMAEVVEPGRDSNHSYHALHDVLPLNYQDG